MQILSLADSVFQLVHFFSATYYNPQKLISTAHPLIAWINVCVQITPHSCMIEFQ
jgi:hypothetical protein